MAIIGPVDLVEVVVMYNTVHPIILLSAPALVPCHALSSFSISGL